MGRVRALVSGIPTAERTAATLRPNSACHRIAAGPIVQENNWDFTKLAHASGVVILDQYLLRLARLSGRIFDPEYARDPRVR
jgi:hypothetical protein